MIYFLYSGQFSTKTRLSELGIDSFRGVDESSFDRKELLYCSSVYAIAVRLSINDLATLAGCEFRSVEKLKRRLSFAERGMWLQYIYSSTPPEDRGLRDIIVRCVQFRTRATLDNLTTQDPFLNAIREAMQRAPDLGFDLLTMPLADKCLRCSHCHRLSPVLLLPCPHAGQHKYKDRECFKETLKMQECYWCYATDVFDSKKGLTWQNTVREMNCIWKWRNREETQLQG